VLLRALSGQKALSPLINHEGSRRKTLFTRKTKRPMTRLSRGASVDQPSPKCCSRRTLALTPKSRNGPTVLSGGTRVIDDGKIYPEARTITNSGIPPRKTKRPRLSLSLGTSADQPSPKCCSRRTVTLTPKSRNGPSVLSGGTRVINPGNIEPRESSNQMRVPQTEPAGGIIARKTKRPRLSLSLGTSADQPSPKCCSRRTLVLHPKTVNGSTVPPMAPMGR